MVAAHRITTKQKTASFPKAEQSASVYRSLTQTEETVLHVDNIPNIAPVFKNNTVSRFSDDLPAKIASPLTYKHFFRAYLKDSNAVGNIYFATYFEWQGVCREAFFLDCVSKNLMALDGMFITKRAENSYMAPLVPFDEIICLVNTRNIKKVSLDLSFRFYKNDPKNTLIATGSQTLAFFSKENKASRIPPEILNKLLKYES